jgi:hypothetical protein
MTRKKIKLRMTLRYFETVERFATVETVETVDRSLTFPPALC